ncbi:calcium-binding protein [Puniceibacterium sp. IMCC21224]|uniref:calcium-binding protein n=1 Tax=Puniceibacterium sp. IMCC21224 TaxID=1618204 RepID=UPI00064D7A74|nr:calcium-binding protein [Puniceibacterium sp. IMCC21224]KMK66447.1 putative calcium-binding protein [Puniceibacterium sp. IMCC21224]
MANYHVTPSNWNNPGFWNGVTATAGEDTLDFTALTDRFDVSFDANSQDLFLSDGTAALRIGAGNAGGGRDAYLGGQTGWSAFRFVTGSEGGDTLTGDAGADNLDGNSGDDSLLGNEGDDVLTGGQGADTMRGGYGADTILGDEGDDSLFGNEDGDSIEGGAGNDSIYGEYGNDYVSGGDGDDHLEGNEGDDTIYGGDGNDWMRGSYDNDALYGGAGDDYLWGGYGDDTFHIENGFGNDTVDAEGVAETNGDTLDLSAVTDALRVDLTSLYPEVGTVSDGLSTLEFDEIENILLGAGVDTVVLGAQGGADVVHGFFAPTDLGGGVFASNDLLDVTDIRDEDDNLIDTSDITVSDTQGDGTGDAVLTFPGAVSLVLAGVSAAQVQSPAQLAALGIPLAEGASDDPADPIDPVDPVDSVDPTDPAGPTAELPQIDGAFEFEATVRFDDIGAGGSQRVFEFGGAGEDSITFGQLGPSTAVLFEIVQDGATSLIVAEDALVEGETATWTVGVDETGFMYIEKDGVQVGEGDGVVPADVPRLSNTLGASSNPDLTPLIGEISDVSITQDGSVWVEDGGSTTVDPADPTDPDDPADPIDPVDPVDPVDPTEPTVPAGPTAELPQIDGAFEFEATVRFDDIGAGGSQRVFEFGGAGEDSITFGQLGPSTAVLFEIVHDGATSLIVAEDALVEGETATWTVGVDETGFMYIEKDGVQVGEGDGVVPADVPRLSNTLGASSNPDLTPLIGEISDVSITQDGSVWVEDSAGTADGTGTDTADIANSDASDLDYEVNLETGTDQYGNNYAEIENVLGGTGDDSLTGNTGDNLLSGGGGDDTLTGGGGDDTLHGGAGDDVFALQDVAGSVTISDFGANGDADQIDLTATAAFASGEDLMAALMQEDGHASLSFDIGDETQNVLIFSEDDLEASDFAF